MDSLVSKNHDITRITIHHGGETFAPDKDMKKYLIITKTEYVQQIDIIKFI